MNCFTRLTSLTFVIVALSFMLLIPAAYADRDHRDFRRPGESIHVLPDRHERIRVNDHPYYYRRGVFYEPRSSGYVVISAPLGAHVRSLPTGYVSFGLDTRRYFYANTTYYLYDDRSRDYVVVEQPARAEALMQSSMEVASAAELFVYPKNGQNEELRDQDRYECHRWAKSQTSYDPSMANQRASLAPDYRRAISACLEGRGYTVR
jgi:hypothetical protein